MQNKNAILYGIAALLVATILLLRPAAQIAPDDEPATATGGNAKTSDETHETASENKPSSLLAGIDVSHYQGDIDWAAVKASGIGFAYLKATDGITYVDARYATHAAELKKLGLPHGGYHFYEPKDDPIAQAKHYLGKVAFASGSLPPVLDVEITSGLKPAQIRAGVMQWLEFVEKQTGCRPMIYSYAAYWNQNLGGEFADYPLWLADYAPRPKLPDDVKTWRFWQHSQKGRVRGIDSSVDLNWFNGDRAALAEIVCKS